MHTKKTATAAERAIVSFIKESQCKDRFDITNVLEILILQASRSIQIYSCRRHSILVYKRAADHQYKDKR